MFRTPFLELKSEERRARGRRTTRRSNVVDILDRKTDQIRYSSEAQVPICRSPSGTQEISNMETSSSRRPGSRLTGRRAAMSFFAFSSQTRFDHLLIPPTPTQPFQTKSQPTRESSPPSFRDFEGKESSPKAAGLRSSLPPSSKEGKGKWAASSSSSASIRFHG